MWRRPGSARITCGRARSQYEALAFRRRVSAQAEKRQVAPLDSTGSELIQMLAVSTCPRCLSGLYYR